ncbi:HIT domain-containing protein [Georgenia sp. TF02-10]|nr:HIT domain-containing protein [Georgenia sp. TF02-10]UNX56386.1 HIT domain-containing protein [Georgenia sp. TF02-10]
MQRLWTPHRMVYVGGQDKPVDDGAEACPFCSAPRRDDADALVVHRGRTAYVVLNLYPYNPGHLLVCPYRHVPDYTDLSAEERAEIGETTATAMRVARAVSAPHGFNLGMNQGAVAGAGIAAHLHQHVVPRWGGDANFLPIIARTKALPQVLGETRELLAAAWPDEGPGGGTAVDEAPADGEANAPAEAAPADEAPAEAAPWS